MAKKAEFHLPQHLPYEEEARLMSDIVGFFIHKLPHAVEEAAEQLDEAVLANELTNRMEDLSDEQLQRLGIRRPDIPKVAAAAAGLFKVAENSHHHGTRHGARAGK